MVTRKLSKGTPSISILLLREHIAKRLKGIKAKYEVGKREFNVNVLVTVSAAAQELKELGTLLDECQLVYESQTNYMKQGGQGNE